MWNRTVIFQITAIGKNTQALEESARSVLYWLRNTPRLGYRPLLWIVVEPEGFATAPAMYESLRRDGAEVHVVPRDYRTPLGTHGKARALEFACELRAERKLSLDTVWVYHQDEETCVGQDTLVGIHDFIRQTRYLVGSGVILYPIDWVGNPSHVQELTRSYDDFRVLDSMTEPGNPTSGFHGSHIIVRADVEDSVGWDAPGYAPAEDLTFEIRVRTRYGAIFGILRGFAYEKGAFSLSDQLRQRRRWMHGVLYALRSSRDLSLLRRFALFYSALSWYSALPSVLILIASILLRYGPLLFVTGVFTGFIWVSMVTGYIEGYRLHAQYLPRKIGFWKLFGHGIIGAMVDVLAPWYALFTRPTMRDFIPKDRPLGGAAPRPSVADRA